MCHVRFHNPDREPSLVYDVILPVDDDVQLSVTQYRNKLYEVSGNFPFIIFTDLFWPLARALLWAVIMLWVYTVMWFLCYGNKCCVTVTENYPPENLPHKRSINNRLLKFKSLGSVVIFIFKKINGRQRELFNILIIFTNITVLLYFWLNKCSLKKSLKY